jgi:hypothetical protein
MPGPSSEHETLVTLVKKRPEAFVRLLAPRLGLERLRTVAPVAGSFSTAPAALHADAAFELRGGDGERIVALVEVQLRIDREKAKAWPAYEAVARRRHAMPACVVVITPSAAVARWAEEPIVLGPSGSSFRAVVIGPNELPRRVRASAPAELVVLSALAHGREGRQGLELVARALRVLHPLRKRDIETARLYFDLLASKMKEQVRRALEETMAQQPYLSDWLNEIHANGIAKGREEGLAEGELSGRRRTLRAVLSARGLLDGASVARLEACSDPDTLELWTARAATASTAAEIFDRP